MLLWTLSETALQLGGVSIRHVRRMLERREISYVRVGRLVKVVPESVHEYVASRMVPAHNHARVGPLALKGDDQCYTNAKTHRTGGQATPTQPAKELDVLLIQLTKRKQR